jgi:TolB-like protein/Tfp pilus assembly protein PilF
MSLLAELKRRNVIRIAIAYGAFAWLIVQLVETVLPVFGVPDAVIRTLFILLAIGFIPALVFAWVYELTPDGLKRETEVDRSQSITPQTGKRLDKVIILVLGIALAYFAVDKFVLDPSRDARMIEEAISGGIPDNSIAVLPFVNMSRDPDNEFFSDGVAEELLNLLAQASGLRVASRTSSFYFKNKDVAIPQIAEQLRVRHVLEGSVRRSGNLIRITAQLIDSRTDAHLWSQTYDRELDDIFAVQDEIAHRIVEEIRLKLGHSQLIGQPGGLSQTDNVDAYQLYLRGLSLLRLRGIDNLRQAAELFEEATYLDPEYARAYEKLAMTYLLVPFYTDEPRPPWLERGEEAARKAIRLDAALPGAHATLGAIYQAAGVSFSRIDAEFSKALQLDPDHVTARQWYGEFLMTVGRSQEFLEAARAAHELDPLAPVVNASLAWAYLYTNDFERAERFAAISLELGMGGTWAEDVLGLVYIYTRRYDEALAIFGREHPDFALNRMVIEAIVDPAKRPDAVAAIEAVDYFRISFWPSELMMLVGATDSALDRALAEARNGEADTRTLWRPHFMAQAGDPRYREIVAVLGLPEYWDQTSWPRICRRAGSDFSCDPAFLND